MAEDFKKYNHLQYGHSPEESDKDFVNFLFENTDIQAPEVDENTAWNALRQKIDAPKRSFGWMKIAASIAIILSVSMAIYLLVNATPEQILVSSLEEKIPVHFPDGSIGVLNEQSSFSYPDRFGSERRVSFTGEAYFDIKKSSKPFIIDANGVEVKVLGTAFNLETTDESVTLYVERGLVAFAKDGKETKVKAGLEAIFNKKTNKVFIKETPSANIMSWRNGYFKFEETPLSEALAKLSEYYDVSFKLGNKKLEKCRISATFDKQSLPEVLELLESILGVEAQLKEKTVKISGQGC
ncbi:MAG: hypothetical protein Tsb0034_26290 [Ekhidna sp.]